MYFFNQLYNEIIGGEEMRERTIQIIKFFINHQDEITFELLSKEFQVSSRTLRNEVNEINTFLQQQDLEPIKTIRGKGLRLVVNKKQKEELLTTIENLRDSIYLTPEERQFDLILASGLGQKPMYVYEKEIEYQVSKSTMDDDMRRVRYLLRQYNIDVVSIPKQGIVLSGVERTVRTMLYDIIVKFLGVTDYQLDEVDESIFDKILFTYMPRQTFYQLDMIYDQMISSREENVYRKQILLFTSIWISRLSLGNTIANTLSDDAMINESEMLHFVDKVILDFNLDCSQNERKYLSFILESFNKKDMTNSIEWVQAQLLTLQLIQHVEKETKIPFSRREELLYEGLYKHLTGLLHRMKTNVQVINPLKDNIASNYPEIYDSVVRFAPAIEEVARQKITLDEIAFLTIYFSTSESRINQELEYIYKIAVICNHGTATAHLLAENLKELFNIEVIAVLSSRELSVLKKLDVDLVFSTVRLEEVILPTLLLNPILLEQDKIRINQYLTEHRHLRRVINKPRNGTNLLFSILTIIEQSGGQVSGDIYQKVVQTFTNHQLKINQEEIQPMLEDVLSESGIRLNVPATNWEEAIEEVAKPLVTSQVIEPRYITAMIDSVKEYGPYIVIGKHLALAHARPEEGVNKLGVSVLTLKEPIEFGHDGNDPVKIIFCLAAVDSYSHLNIMKNLIELIHDEEKVQKLTEATSKEEFQKILYQM
ncbi:PTS sugar transporter subunit IIA [Granulicatella sp. s8]|uniref:PTS sugar transporter subunit IIA n=2 Tax=Granulicatella seriolae TaxID=2967226 RepID=A0ABT1WQD5_9LACT